MRKPKFNPQAGMSVTELLVVLVILGIIVAIAIGQLGNSEQVLTRKNIARTLKVSLERARSDSVKRRAITDETMARVVINSPVSFSVFTDLNQSDAIETGESQDVFFTNGVSRIVGDFLSYPIIIRFDRRGFISATNGAGATVAPVIIVCDGCTAGTLSNENSTTVSVSATGTSAITEGVYIPVIAGEPGVSTVSGGSQIRSNAVVNPSPTPSGSPPPCTVVLVLCI